MCEFGGWAGDTFHLSWVNWSASHLARRKPFPVVTLRLPRPSKGGAGLSLGWSAREAHRPLAGDHTEGRQEHTLAVLAAAPGVLGAGAPCTS